MNNITIYPARHKLAVLMLSAAAVWLLALAALAGPVYGRVVEVGGVRVVVMGE